MIREPHVRSLTLRAWGYARLARLRRALSLHANAIIPLDDAARRVPTFKRYRVASVATLYPLFIHLYLEFGVAGGAGEGDYIADVGHAGDEEHQTLESESEA